MDSILALLFGVTQGVTEFLPISSSGHLVLLHGVLELSTVSDLSFDVALHGGTTLAVLFVFGRDVWTIVRRSFSRHPSPDRRQQRRILRAVVIGTIPAALAGYFFEDIIEQSLRAPLIVAAMLVLVGIVMLIVERYARQQRELQHAGEWEGFWVGVAQALALIPGTSRSGITIITGMILGLKREHAARFSFILSIPIIIGAFLLQTQKMIASGEALDVQLFVIGVLSAALVGVVAIRFLLSFLARAGLTAFAYYRFVLAAVVILWVVLR